MFTLPESYNALRHRDEFAVKQYNNGLVCLDYIVCFPGTFDSTEEEVTTHANYLAGVSGVQPELVRPQAEAEVSRFAQLRRNFRGVTFDEASGQIVSLPLHKFFNLNQTAETQFHELQHLDAVIYEKLDGSMIHFFIHPKTGDLQAATCRSTETPQAQEALQIAKSDPVLTKMIEEVIVDGWTPIFEFVAAHNQIVVHYPRRRLVYLVSRNRFTGQYRFHEQFPDKASRFEFRFADIFNYLDKKEFEGYVCHLSNDMFVKAKTPWYLERHRAVDALMRPAYKLYQVVFDGIMDDLLASSPDRHKPVLQKIYEEAQRDLLNEQRRVETLFAQMMEQDVPLSVRKADRALRKSFVEKVKREAPDDFSELMTLYSGNNPQGGIKDKLMESYRVKYPNRVLSDMDVEP
jgi:T4 RnlA family RNA ligase